MSNQNKVETLHIQGMTCPACEVAIVSALKKIPGIDKVKASFSEGTVEYIETAGKVDIEIIKAAINEQGYSVLNEKPKKTDGSFTSSQFIGIAIIVLAAYVIIKNTVGFDTIPELSPSMGYIALFIVGIVTSLHCVAMCGGINISQCMKVPEGTGTAGKIRPSLLYNSGRVISYTVIGGLAGALGAAVSFSGPAKGLVAILSGIFMIIMGLNLFGTFPWISKITPRIPTFLRSKKAVASSGRGPLVVGLLNGLMPCGPLQAMQLYALGTGSFLVGASSMFFFSLGTVPLMFGLGMFSTLMSSKFNKKMMQVGAVLVMALGLVMLSRGMAISGMNFQAKLPSTAPAVVNAAVVGNGVQSIETKLTSNGYPVITVTKGVPVRWNMKADAADITGCNGTLIIPQFNVEKKLEPGDNIIEFTPTETGTIPYSCWMGMIKSKINVVDATKTDGSSAGNSTVADTATAGIAATGSTITDSTSAGSVTVNAATVPSSDANIATLPGGGSCCGGGGAVTNPTADLTIEKAVIKNGVQTITVDVDALGYTPTVIVMEQGIKTRIKFNVKELNGCNSQVYFSQDKMSLDFSKDQFETPFFKPSEDIAFSCGMGMLNGYIKVVPDLEKADINQIKKELLAN